MHFINLYLAYLVLQFHNIYIYILRRADNESSSCKNRSISNIERVYVALIFLFGLFYVITLKDENIFKPIRNILPFFDFLLSALFTVMLI